MTNIILCGGSGTRLWPISRTLMPKQFVPLIENKSLFELTMTRNKDICDDILVVSNQEQYFVVKDKIANIKKITKNKLKFLLEPIGRDTAGAIALACMSLDEETIVLITPSDHLIKDEKNYKKVIHQAKKFAQDDFLVTFGIEPTSPETGYGYIQANKNEVISFVEKPDKKTAKRYIEIGGYYYNSGMFMFKAGVFLQQLKLYEADIYTMSKKAISNSKQTNNTIKIDINDMLNIPTNSIDYAVMEKSNIVKMIPSDIKWNDIGSFDALSNEIKNDKNNNLILSNKVVKTINIKDTIVVDTDDALLLCKKGSSQKVKQIVNKLKSTNETLTKIHLTGFRPWGSYTVLQEKSGYKIKNIIVKSNKRLSLQSHKYRNEHWIVVKGVATITINDKIFKLQQNQSTYIQAGDKHRLANDTKNDLIITEVQVGSYTGEDDIIRYDDDFSRS
ncbi:MAG: mannose-1-phosphate guanylyltransferase/mannose-6-phosphate isomerase [Epsilonproteobacteria bacterium]|nr:MAG: mannose-1-phosphate guanylyltransferase/mannose-6-phosphate isomerase [Campylobacterota bacterium]